MLKNFSESFKRSFLIVLAYGIAFGLGYITRLANPDLMVSFYVSEQELFATYTINLKDLIDLIVIGPVFTIISFLLLKSILDQLRTLKIPEKDITFYYIIFLIAIVIFNYGNFIHVTMNRLNSDIDVSNRTQQFYYSIYFLDEFIGHLFITLGFFIVLTEVCFIHTIHLKSISTQDTKSEFMMKNREPFWNVILGVGLGIGTAVAYLEGQCSFVFLILNPIISIVLLFDSKKKGVKLKENSLISFFLIMTIAFCFTVLIWGLITGLKPFYPFFYQNSEL